MSNDEMMKSPFAGNRSKANFSDFEHSSFFRHLSLGIRHYRQDPESTWRCSTKAYLTVEEQNQTRCNSKI